MTSSCRQKVQCKRTMPFIIHSTAGGAGESNEIYSSHIYLPCERRLSPCFL